MSLKLSTAAIAIFAVVTVAISANSHSKLRRRNRDAYDVYGGFNPNRQEPQKNAVVIVSANGSGTPMGVYGTLTLSQRNSNSPVRINGTIFNLPNGKHGMHVHTQGDLRDGCTSAGVHYNPFKLTHGDIRDRNRHLGDLGNIESRQGVANVDLNDYGMTLSGANSVLARAMVVHALVDDLGKGGNEESTKTGNSGARLACGIIGIV